MIGKPHGQRCCLYRVRIGDLCPDPPFARSRWLRGRARRASAVIALEYLLASRVVCGTGRSPRRARCGERDPQRIADDHQERGGRRWQAHRHTARADRSPRRINGRRHATHPLRHVPFTGSPATRITGEKMIVSGHTAREIAAWVALPAMAASSSQDRTAPIAGEKDGKQLLAAGRNSDQHDLAVCDQRPTIAASRHPRSRRSGVPVRNVSPADYRLDARVPACRYCPD